MNISKVAVIGAGLMGSGIALVAAMSGFEVALRDVDQSVLDKAMAMAKKALDRAAEKGKLSTEQAEAALGRLTPCTDLKEALAGAQYVIEAVPERLELKKQVFAELDRLAEPEAILATNTSELSIASIAAATSTPERVIGTHWFFPPQIMKLIEVVKGGQTSPATLETTLRFCTDLGKETVVCADAQGFITSRAISVLIAECLRIHQEGIASIEDIDKAMRLGFNHPIGPFQLVDMSGVDVVFHALEGLSQEYGERFNPTQEMAKLVEGKNLGRKTGKGFYDYGGK
ncbi:MAG: 3-hydroxyacyl-CoA dehydrogenase family protein [Proteobacteria bacterium]|nr:3-hydroxyacyl-CoA dehydrogenase family protein [Pseudomonadota bacterium]MBU1451628.1 3-hydroxyacyl-CoA dehydrogenase family protein [Pseudomonadota bacterium]MBU2469291.1 3-hydroxyacyl-CoA dehydrogenase family protein [Pseudomonadota bacterium]MBU2518001.1 3-hydroxyacyl-CoA dehydrogenase family protein [Pseudomonadota bacterium]